MKTNHTAERKQEHASHKVKQSKEHTSQAARQNKDTPAGRAGAGTGVEPGAAEAEGAGIVCAGLSAVSTAAGRLIAGAAAPGGVSTCPGCVHFAIVSNKRLRSTGFEM